MLLEGVYTAVVTPFTADDEVDTEALAQLVEHVIDGGGEGIVALGTAGEGYAVSSAERGKVLRTVYDAAAGRVGLVAGATAMTTRDTAENAVLAKECGYKAAMVAPPPYVLPNANELVNHYRRVAQQADLPILMYDFPARVGVTIGWDVLDGLVDERRVIGLKEASGDMARIVEMRMRYADRYEIVCGADTLVVDFALWGARGWIAGASGFIPREHVEILRLASAGRYEEARTKLKRLLPLLFDMEHAEYGHKVRVGLEMHGLPGGRARLPIQELDAASLEVFAANVRSAQ